MIRDRAASLLSILKKVSEGVFRRQSHKTMPDNHRIWEKMPNYPTVVSMEDEHRNIKKASSYYIQKIPKLKPPFPQVA